MDYERLSDLLVNYLVELIDDGNTIAMLSQYPFDLIKDDLYELGFDLDKIEEIL